MQSGDACFDWAPLPCTGLQTTTDALRVAGLRVPVTVDTARRVAAVLTERDPEGGVVELLTPRIVDLIAQHARWLAPSELVVPRDANLADPDVAWRLSNDLDNFFLHTGQGFDELVGPIADDWVLTGGQGVGPEKDGGWPCCAWCASGPARRISSGWASMVTARSVPCAATVPRVLRCFPGVERRAFAPIDPLRASARVAD